MIPSSQAGTIYSNTEQVDIALLNSLPVPVFICDTDGNVHFYNDSLAKLWSTPLAVGQSIFAGYARFYKHTGMIMQSAEPFLRSAYKDGRKLDGEEFTLQLSAGVTRAVMLYASPVNKGGELAGSINTIIDTTDQKSGEEKEAMLAAIIESSEDAVISKTLDGIISSWNRSAELMYGYTSEEAVGQPMTMIVPEDRYNEEYEILNKIRSGDRIEHYETFRLTKSREEIPVSLTVSPINNKQGEIIGASNVARDISKQKQSEESLQRYAENLEVLNSVGKIVSENLELQDILQKVTDATTQLSRAAFGAFFYNQLDENGESYMLYTLSGAPRNAFEKLWHSAQYRSVSCNIQRRGHSSGGRHPQRSTLWSKSAALRHA